MANRIPKALDGNAGYVKITSIVGTGFDGDDVYTPATGVAADEHDVRLVVYPGVADADLTLQIGGNAAANEITISTVAGDPPFVCFQSLIVGATPTIRARVDVASGVTLSGQVVFKSGA